MQDIFLVFPENGYDFIEGNIFIHGSQKRYRRPDGIAHVFHSLQGAKRTSLEFSGFFYAGRYFGGVLPISFDG
jgi:hypothetical protein